MSSNFPPIPPHQEPDFSLFGMHGREHHRKTTDAARAAEIFGIRQARIRASALSAERQSRLKRRRGNVTAMMTAEPSKLMEAAATDLQEQPRNIQTYDEEGPTFATVTGIITGSWVQLNLSKEQAMLVERIRCCQPSFQTGQSAVGFKWGRPAGAIGRGAPGHLSPGQIYTLPVQGGPSTDAVQQLRAFSDVHFEWNWGTSGGNIVASDPTIQEIDLKPNFVLIRSYSIVVAGTNGQTHTPYVNFYGRIVNLHYPRILSVRR